MCLHFIAKYVSQLFTKGKIRKWLDDHPTLTFLSMITPSDYAFVATLVKNSEPVWSAKPGDVTSPAKPLYTSGGKLKREVRQVCCTINSVKMTGTKPSILKVYSKC